MEVQSYCLIAQVIKGDISFFNKIKQKRARKEVDKM